MTRKLAFLNLLLVTLLGAAAWQFQARRVEARTRQEAQLRRLISAPPAPAVPVVEAVKPVEAASYVDVATKMMFSRDRNPTVIVEAAPPPPEDPIPTFPAVFGVMEIGGPITVFMSDGTSSAQKAYRAGDMVGPFKLVSAARNELVLTWKDKTFNKTLAELKPKAGQENAAASAAAASPSGSPAVSQAARPTFGGVEADKRVTEGQKEMVRDGVMIDTGAVNRSCMPSDSSPAGTVLSGYRKVVRATPFGRSCFWEPAR